MCGRFFKSSFNVDIAQICLLAESTFQVDCKTHLFVKIKVQILLEFKVLLLVHSYQAIREPTPKQLGILHEEKKYLTLILCVIEGVETTIPSVISVSIFYFE